MNKETIKNQKIYIIFKMKLKLNKSEQCIINSNNFKPKMLLTTHENTLVKF